MSDSSIPEAVVGRVFLILGVKNWEQAANYYPARAVFQDNNVRTKSGRAPCEVFEEISNALASITAARCALAVGILQKMIATFRDAYQAYLQIRCDTWKEALSLIELPKEWWLNDWFQDEVRTKPKFRRPAVVMRYAVPGHPESRFLCEQKVVGILIARKWIKVEGWCGVFLHEDGSIFIVYVDDFMLVATRQKAFN